MWGSSGSRSTVMAVGEVSRGPRTRAGKRVSPPAKHLAKGIAAIGAVASSTSSASDHGSASAAESPSLTSGRRAAELLTD